MDLAQSIIIGIVEGITEFLPISSTAHMILVSAIMRIPESEFVKTFEIVIQLGAILSVVALYFKQIFQWENIKRLFVAFLPTAFIGLIFYQVIKSYLMSNLSVIVWALVIGGAIMILFEKWYQEKADAADELSQISYRQCLLIGIFQSMAIVPGVSRSGATIIGGLLMGLKRKTIMEFSFMLAVPTMAAAAGLDLLKAGTNFSSSEYGLLAAGFIVSFIVAWLSIKFLLNFIRRHTFIPFGIYRVIIGLVLAYFII